MEVSAPVRRERHLTDMLSESVNRTLSGSPAASARTRTPKTSRSSWSPSSSGRTRFVSSRTALRVNLSARTSAVHELLSANTVNGKHEWQDRFREISCKFNFLVSFTLLNHAHRVHILELIAEIKVYRNQLSNQLELWRNHPSKNDPSSESDARDGNLKRFPPKGHKIWILKANQI